MISTTQASVATRPTARPPFVSPADFGAVGDDAADDTDALQAAVDAAAERGLPLRVTGGTFLCGTLRLRSGTTLVVEPGATIRGTGDLDRYDHFVRPDGNGEPQGDRRHRALILVENAGDVLICGGGTIDGGDVFDAQGEAGMRGPHLILIGSSRRVRVEGVTLRDAGNYAILSEFSHDVEARGLRILGGWDGLHVRGDANEPSTKLALIDCDVRTGDDCVAIKYADDFTIRGCRLNSSCNAVRAIGPVTRLTITHNLFHGPGYHPHRKQVRHNMLSGVVLQPGTWDKTRGRVDGVLLADNTTRDLKCVMRVVTTPGNDFGRVDVVGLTATGVRRRGRVLRGGRLDRTDGYRLAFSLRG